MNNALKNEYQSLKQYYFFGTAAQYKLETSFFPKGCVGRVAGSQSQMRRLNRIFQARQARHTRPRKTDNTSTINYSCKLN